MWKNNALDKKYSEFENVEKEKLTFGEMYYKKRFPNALLIVDQILIFIPYFYT